MDGDEDADERRRRMMRQVERTVTEVGKLPHRFSRGRKKKRQLERKREDK